jgi:poly-gamma-glutamate synthesis protein (capsule biosynthesis protein)
MPDQPRTSSDAQTTTKPRRTEEHGRDTRPGRRHDARPALEAAGSTLVAGHSAHVPQGVCGHTLFDLGDFSDDYAVDPLLRNDLGLLWLVTVDVAGPRRVEAVPPRLEFASTRRANGVETTLLLALLEERCAAVGSTVRREGEHLVFASR